MTPGGNALSMALRVIAPQIVQYEKFANRITNEIGFDVAAYQPAVQMSGSLQAVDRRLYAQFGLDFQKNYVMFYTPHEVIDVARDVSGDKFTFGASKYQCESNVNWFPIDGWTCVLAVEVRQ